jgi:AcrR family transcriptional regulator
MRRRPTPTTWSWQADRGARARTYRILMAEAMALVHRGRIPAVAEVALNAGVSRATAYRYFRSRSKLVTAVLEEALRPVRSYAPQSADGLARLRELFEKTYPRFTGVQGAHARALQLALGAGRSSAPACSRRSRSAAGTAAASCTARQRRSRRSSASRPTSGCSRRCRSSTASSPTSC